MKIEMVKAAIANMMCDGQITEVMVGAFLAKHGYMSDAAIEAAIKANPQCKSERELVCKLFA